MLLSHVILNEHQYLFKCVLNIRGALTVLFGHYMVDAT